MTKTQTKLCTILKDEGNRISAYLNFLQEEGQELLEQNLVLDLGDVSDLEVEQLLKFLPFSNQHQDSGKSFVVVSPVVAMEEIPEELITVPTLREAEDLIQMEEIERDLGF